MTSVVHVILNFPMSSPTTYFRPQKSQCPLSKLRIEMINRHTGTLSLLHGLKDLEISTL